MFQLYTDDARRVVSAAHGHAVRLQWDAVGIEHLVLALIEYGRGPVEETFFALNITPTEAGKQMALLAGTEPITEPAERSRSLPHTDGAREVLTLSLDEKRQLQHNYLGSEHLLLALLRHLDNPWAEPEPASDLLERLGVDPREMRQELLSRMPTDNVRGTGPALQMDWWARLADN